MTEQNSNAPPPDTESYQPAAIEAKWQARWDECGTNEPDLDGAERPFYNLMMFPYPSAEGLHVGNMFAFTGSDVYGRFKRLQGYDVFEPMGFDAFGIHSENFAIKVGTHPARLIPANIANFRRQLKRIGGMFDWRHELSTTDPSYYKWTQWLFLQLYKAGKAYKKYAAVNWCPACKTVLANEQVISGFCERHPDTRVEQRTLDQWFFRITEYAEHLLADLGDASKMDWSDTTVTAQRNWLGRSEGAEIEFAVDHNRTIRVFTTRPDTIHGATFMVLAPEHPLVGDLTSVAQREAVDAYRTAAASHDLISRKIGDREKTGVFTGAFARNPATGRTIPVWIADYVLMEYGTGAIMAVPAHDERDLEFAQRYGLQVTTAVGEDGRLVESGSFSGMTVEEGKAAIVRWLETSGAGKGVVQYRLHDWCISRQRYWGPPIPIIYCDDHGAVPVPEQDLPVILPDIEDFRPDDSGISPLARHEEWYYTPCPVCGKRARRETDVSDTFLDSAWYYLRYPSTEFTDRAFDAERTRRWCPVATYIGGNEHAVLHLLYSRFIAMVLHEIGLVHFDEPFAKFRAHGLIVKDGAKMSKSRGNVVIPDAYIARWGADTFRMYLMFLGPFQEGGDFRDEGISGPRRFLDKVWNMVGDCVRNDTCGGDVRHAAVVKWHQTIKRATESIEGLRYNSAIAAMMELVNVLREDNCCDRQVVQDLVIMLAPFAPHFSEECWERLGHTTSVFEELWPEWDENLVVEGSVEIAVQVNGKTRSTITVARDSGEEHVAAIALADATTQRFIAGKTIRKRIYVPNRLLNVVVG
ncbi:MAG: leucine--tRNA ligase [Gemmatimonadota bacterium]